MKELEDTSPANKAEGQKTTSANRTKFLESGRDSETSTARQSSTDVDVDDVDLEISSFFHYEAWFQKMSGERRSLNSNNIIPMLPTALGKGIIMAVYIQTCLKLLVVFRSSDEFTAT